MVGSKLQKMEKWNPTEIVMNYETLSFVGITGCSSPAISRAPRAMTCDTDSMFPIEKIHGGYPI